MKNRCLILIGSIAVFMMFLQIGCQKQAVVSPAAPPEAVKVQPSAQLTPPAPSIPPKPSAPEPLTPPPPVTEPEKPAVTPPAEELAPKIVFESVVHDFGEVGPRTKNTCEFKFSNTGSALLKIGKIHATCGCTVPQLSKEEYVPGESGVITVEYHPGLQGGPQTRRLDVPTNDKANQRITLVVKALVVVKIEYEPKKLSFSVKTDSNSPRPMIKIHSIDSQPFAINGFSSHPEGISINYDPNVKKPQFTVEPKIEVEKLQKEVQGYIQINITYPGYDSITIPFTVIPRFKVSPPAIVLLDAKPQESVDREVVVLNNYGEPFEIESAASQKNIIKVLSQEKAGDRYKIKVSITPPAAESNPRMFTDTLFINIKGGVKLEVACKGFYPSSRETSRPLP